MDQDSPRTATETPRDALAAAIRTTATIHALTDSELSRITLIPRETLRRKLAGGSEFTMGELDAIATALHVDLTELVGTYTAAKVA